ncbi:MAG TPA: FkbM family methyltransferase [Candidatus Dormibacteraeota bacterium]
MIYYESRLGFASYQSMLVRNAGLLRTGGVSSIELVIDCGANVGFFSKMIADVSPHATIHAIEPVPITFDCLKRNFSGMPRVHAHQLALSDLPGQLRMAVDASDPSISHVDEGGEIIVPAITLDEFVAQNEINGIDLLKIDTETFEAHVLRGARSSLARTRYVLIEITIENNEHYTLSSLMSLLHGDGFDFQLVAFRNYADRGEGRIPIMDCLLVNRWTQEGRALSAAGSSR